MNILPRSLGWRTLLMILAAIIACQAITFGVFAYFRDDLLARRGQEFVRNYISLVRTALERSPPEEVAKHLVGTTGMQIRLVKNPELPARTFRIPTAEELKAQAEAPPTLLPLDPRPVDAAPRPNEAETNQSNVFPNELVRSLNRKYGFDAVRRTLPPNEAIWIRMRSDGWWLMIPAQGFETTIPWPIIFGLLSALTLIAVLVSVYVVQLSRPLRALADAAGKFELGQRLQLPLAGPAEIQAVTSQFNAMAERLADHDSERRVMLAGLPHDLRAPLTRAKLRLALMDSPEEAETRQGFERDFNEVERIANQFVAYLRGLDGDQSSFEKTDMQALVRDRVASWHGTGQNVAVEQIEACTLNVDRSAVERVIDNLISNALTHGAAPVRVRGQHAAGQQQTEYRIEVDDHGVGIPLAQREEALKPFTRLDSARGVSGHCGLGLAVVQSVARLHEGRIELDDAPGGGLRAALVLPLILPQAA